MLKEKYINKLINNDDFIKGKVQTDEIPYDNRYFVLNILKEMSEEYESNIARLFTALEEMSEYKFMYEDLCK